MNPADQRAGGRNGRQSRRRLAVAFLSAAVLTGAASAALAQDPTDPDTELTPKPTENTRWSLVGGAKYRAGGKLVNDASPTSYEVDFYSTSFSPDWVADPANNEGFFSGAECIDEDVPFEDEALRNCERRPAMYRFWVDDVGDEHIEKVPTDELVDDSEKEGFVGAVAWIDGKRALAVGGTGTYPRREPSPAAPKDGESHDAAYLRKDKFGETGSPDKPAGLARAWIYEDKDGDGNSSWREITDELPLDKKEDGSVSPERMGALTALECTSFDIVEGDGATQKLYMPKGTCLAGGLQRMWWWRPDKEAFDPDPVTNLEVVRGAVSQFLQGDNPNTDATAKADFHHRVRQIRFSDAHDHGTIAAVTAGCCVDRVQLKEGPDGLPSGEADTALGGRILEFSAKQEYWEASEASFGLSTETAGAGGAPLADSLYSIATAHSQVTREESSWRKRYLRSGVASPGGKPSPDAEEPGSRITNEDESSRSLGSVRLLAADGDFSQPREPTEEAVLNNPNNEYADGTLDWAVGSLKQGSSDGTAQGVAYTTLDPIGAVPAPMSCPLYTFIVTNQGGNCELVRENITDASLESKRLIGMGTYALNSLHFIFKTKNAWAAGDRGAIVRLGAAGKLGSEVEPRAPRLKPGRQKPLAERAPFEAKRPESRLPGAVPPRESRAVETLPKDEIVPYGSADPTHSREETISEAVTEMAMSRDGSEGWAVGSGAHSYGGTMTLQRFDGERWVRCSTDGLAGAHEPDRACDSLAWLSEVHGTNQPVNLTAITRIPLEQDGDPSNDDEFEAIAVGSFPGNPGNTRSSTVLHYRDGVWAIDEAASHVIQSGMNRVRAETSMVFRSPGDGWLVANLVEAAARQRVFHYGGGDWPNGRWVPCSDPAHSEECGAAAGLEPLVGDFGAQQGYLQLAGDTLFIAGNRRGPGGDTYPYVYSNQPDQAWQKEYDPGCEEIIAPAGSKSCRPRPSNDSDPVLDEDEGFVFSFSAVDLGGGRVAGWLVGSFGLPAGAIPAGTDDYDKPILGPKYKLMRRDPDAPPGSERAWSYRRVNDAATDFLPGVFHASGEPPRLIGFRDENGEERAFISMSGGRGMTTHNPPLEYDAKRDRWGVWPTPIKSTTDVRVDSQLGEITAMTPDGQGGVWLAARTGFRWAIWDELGRDYQHMWAHDANFYYRYTNRRPKAVFEDSPSPVSELITDLDGSSDGTVWISTESERLYRYDRIAGWERVTIPEWDPGRVVTRRSKAYAVAVNDAGQGIAVGEEGRIANISSDSVALDPASVNRCSEAPPPCGTPRTLRAAAVAPDGSALAGGEQLTMTWRPAGGHFRLVDPPRSSASARITGLSMPDPAHAWATLDNGEIWGGTLIDPQGRRPWRWVRESGAAASRDELGGQFARLFALEVDSAGRGLAVGSRGAMLERSPDGTWKRLVTGFLDNLFSVALPPQGYGDGTLVGGGSGLILTRADGRFHVARPADHLDPVMSEGVELYGGRIVGLAISGGSGDGDTEAWAASQTGFEGHFIRPGRPHALFHYGSGDDPSLSPETRAAPLGDAPPEQPDDLTLAAFGRSDCQEVESCGPFAGTNHFHDLLARRINEEVSTRKARSAGPLTAISTGDLSEAPGRDDRETSTLRFVGGGIHTLNQPNVAHNQWRQFVADPLLENGIPVLGALGERDLSRIRRSGTEEAYQDPRQLAGAGLTKQWRETFASMPAPWGKQAPFATEDYEYRPVPAGAGAVEHPDIVVEDPTKPVPDQTVEDPTKGTEDPTVTTPHPGDQQVGTTTVPDPTKGIDADRKVWLPRPGDQKVPPRFDDRKIEGGAHTHYALDVVRKSDGKELSRIVVADTSHLRSLTASDANQNPAEPQQAWLEQVLCVKGSAADTGSCTREQNTAAVVVTTTPPYSYGAGAVEQTQAEAASFEALMLRHKVTALITGHMGWNGLYYTFAPSLHFPQPGGEHPDSTRPPTGPGDDRGPDPSDLPIPDAGDITGDSAVSDAFPTVIASSAGGRFGPRGDDDGTGSQGFWHGYSVVRVPANGDPTKVIVEQRPILDWINITAKSHVLRPQQKLDLEGIGREPFGTETTARVNEIDSHAITHCYDLLFADPDKPWLPLEAEDASEEQLAAQGKGCPNRQPASSELQAQSSQEEGSGESGPCAPYVCLPAQIGTINHQTGDVRAGGGEQERTFGLAVLTVGEQTATWPIAFEPRPSFSPPRVPPPPPPQPPVPPTPPPPSPVGTVGNFSLPTPPALPSLPLGAELVPPAPPIPPPPPGAANVAPLNLFLSTPGINIAPQSTVIPPPAPPIQPAPPGGARKEARQRQAAAQKSGSEADTSDSGVDTAEAPPSATGSAMTRLEYTRGAYDTAAPSITTLTHRHQPSAWVTGLQWGGGMTLMALVLAFGWITVRPTPRRRQPEVPAPAYARTRRR